MEEIIAGITMMSEKIRQPTSQVTESEKKAENDLTILKTSSMELEALYNMLRMLLKSTMVRKVACSC